MSVSAAFILLTVVFGTIGIGHVIESFKRAKYKGMDIFRVFWFGMFLILLAVLSAACAIKYYVPN